MNDNESIITSTEALAKLIDVFRMYRANNDKIVTDIFNEISYRIKSLARVQEKAQNEVDHYQRELSKTSHDDRSEYYRIKRKLQEAEENLKKIDFWINQVADEIQQFKRVNYEVKSHFSNHLPRAITVLEDRLSLIKAILNVQMPSEAKKMSLNSKSTVSESISRDVSYFSLPSGFQWIKLENISHEDDLPIEDGFTKVSKAIMENGFSILKKDVLPALQSEQNDPQNYFLSLDQKNGKNEETGILRIYQAFFGNDCIALDKGRGDGKYGVSSGRHRIAVAKSLGWTAVPAKII